MKLILDIPDWAQERHIYVMAGIEMLAYKLFGEEVINVKTARCNYCGDCCRQLKPGMGLPLDAAGTCTNLIKVGAQWECSLGVQRPFGCSVGLEQEGRIPGLHCAIKYQQEKL